MGTTPRSFAAGFSRRALVGGSLAGAAALSFAPFRAVAAPFSPLVPAPARAAAGKDAPDGWRTWHLSSPSELRPANPGAVPQNEIDEVKGYLAAPTDAMTAAIADWGTGPAGLGWVGKAGELFNTAAVAGSRQSRLMALLQTAVNDAILAAWDAQIAIGRKGPAATDSSIVPPAGTDPAKPTFPDLRAAAAGAATTVLAYALPDDAKSFDDLAQQAAMSGVWSGAAFPSDAKAGLALGQAVGAKAVERGKNDGSAVKWDPATQPHGPGHWEPTPPKHLPPLDPLGGTWKTWVLERNDELRPALSTPFQSARWKAELAAVKDAVDHRTFQQETEARWRQSTGVYLSFGLWGKEQILRNGLSAPEAARVLAYATVAVADAITAVWDAKYVTGWWTMRPVTADPTIVTAFPTPPYPAYPGGYSAASGAIESVLGAFFPDVAADFATQAWIAARSRTWAGIHYPIDNEVGLTMGRQTGRLVADLARADGIGSPSS